MDECSHRSSKEGRSCRLAKEKISSSTLLTTAADAVSKTYGINQSKLGTSLLEEGEDKDIQLVHRKLEVATNELIHENKGVVKYALSAIVRQTDGHLRLADIATPIQSPFRSPVGDIVTLLEKAVTFMPEKQQAVMRTQLTELPVSHTSGHHANGKDGGGAKLYWTESHAERLLALLEIVHAEATDRASADIVALELQKRSPIEKLLYPIIAGQCDQGMVPVRKLPPINTLPDETPPARKEKVVIDLTTLRLPKHVVSEHGHAECCLSNNFSFRPVVSTTVPLLQEHSSSDGFSGSVFAKAS